MADPGTHHRRIGSVKQFLLAVISIVFAAFTCIATSTARADWQAGVAKVSITPDKPMWMSGYASRKKPAEGKETELWAKALVLQDDKGQRVVIVTLDLVGIGRDLSISIREEIEKAHKLERGQIALCTSHTHSGPVVGNNLNAMYFLDEAHQKLVAEYQQALHRKVVAAVAEAIKDVKPAKVSFGSGSATFAVNRRNNPEKDVPKLKEANALKGPVDHDVPVLNVAGSDGKIRGLLFGYACHATTLDWFRWSGDYPAYAQQFVEEAHAGAVALFWAGCGADQNPIPRRQNPLAIQYGKELAEAVNKVAAGEMKAINGSLAWQYREIPLTFAKLPTADELKVATESKNIYEASRARMLLKQIENGKPLSATYPYPVQTWRFGSGSGTNGNIGAGPRWILLGGEVVVDFALRFKKEHGPNTWIAGYTNDVMAYIPSLRVLKEGGYEGGGAMVYYGLPSPWSETVEEDIAKMVAEQVKALETK